MVKPERDFVMANADTLIQRRPFGATMRRDAWWAQPALVFAGAILLIACVIANRLIPGRETVEQAHAAAAADHKEPVPVEM